MRIQVKFDDRLDAFFAQNAGNAHRNIGLAVFALKQGNAGKPSPSMIDDGVNQPGGVTGTGFFRRARISVVSPTRPAPMLAIFSRRSRKEKSPTAPFDLVGSPISRT